MRLITELRVSRCTDSPEKFKERLIDRLVQSFPDTTIDDLVSMPDEAIRYCDLIRDEARAPELTNAVILKALMNIRRQKICPPGLKNSRKRTKWDKILREAGIPFAPDRFYEELVDGVTSMYRESTVDEMLCHPNEAKSYCDYIRRRISCSTLTDALILRALLNHRKSIGHQ